MILYYKHPIFKNHIIKHLIIGELTWIKNKRREEKWKLSMIKTRKNKKPQSVKKKQNKIAMRQQKISKFRVKIKKNKAKKMKIGTIYPQRKDF